MRCAWPEARPRPRRGGADGQPAGVPDHGLREVPVRGGPEGQGAAQEVDQRLGEGSQVPAEDRQGRLRHQDAQCQPSSSTRATRSRSRCSSEAERWPTPSSARRSSTTCSEAVGPAAKVETQARLEGRNMTMVLAPDKKALDQAAGRREPNGDTDAADEPDDETPARASATDSRRPRSTESSATTRRCCTAPAIAEPTTPRHQEINRCRR